MTQQELYAAAAAHADSTLVQRLRERIADTLLAGLPYNRDGDEAADRIERLEAEVERLNAMLTSAMYEAKAMMDEIKRLGGGMRISLEDLP